MILRLYEESRDLNILTIENLLLQHFDAIPSLEKICAKINIFIKIKYFIFNSGRQILRIEEYLNFLYNS